jgi:hypothetical protein
MHHPVFYLKQHFGDWILSPSSGKNLLCWGQLTEVVRISGHQQQPKIGYINQPQYKPSAKVKAHFKNIKKLHTYET